MNMLTQQEVLLYRTCKIIDVTVDELFVKKVFHMVRLFQYAILIPRRAKLA